MSDASTWQTVAAFLTPATVFAILLVLHIVLPARRADGYAYRGAAGTPGYRLNGVAVFVGALVICSAEQEDGERKILCNGFWGAARHMNYTGEILEALGMALALGHFTNAWAWMYFAYLTVFPLSASASMTAAARESTETCGRNTRQRFAIGWFRGSIEVIRL